MRPKGRMPKRMLERLGGRNASSWSRGTPLAAMEEPAEIAVLTAEYISSTYVLTALDNVPLEISHILREIELKDAKVKGAPPH